MHDITTHVVEGKGGGNDTTRITALDAPGQGGACHVYQITDGDPNVEKVLGTVQFQNGPIQEVGLNGVQQEHMLAIVIDRLSAFQAGKFANAYNQEALQYTKAALGALHQRTKDRVLRQVEGHNVA